MTIVQKQIEQQNKKCPSKFYFYYLYFFLLIYNSFLLKCIHLALVVARILKINSESMITSYKQLIALL